MFLLGWLVMLGIASLRPEYICQTFFFRFLIIASKNVITISLLWFFFCFIHCALKCHWPSQLTQVPFFFSFRLVLASECFSLLFYDPFGFLVAFRFSFRPSNKALSFLFTCFLGAKIIGIECILKSRFEQYNYNVFECTTSYQVSLCYSKDKEKFYISS